MTSLVDRFIHKYGRLPTERDPDYLEMLQMGKFRVVDVPDAQPGSCCNCGASKRDGRTYIDIGRHVEWYGAVFFCGLCLAEIATAVGLFKRYEDQILSLMSENSRLQTLHDQGDTLYSQVKHVFKEFEGYYANLHSLRDDNASSSKSGVIPYQKSPKQEPDLPESKLDRPILTDNSEPNTAKPRASKSTPSPRSKNISSLADILDSQA